MKMNNRGAVPLMFIALAIIVVGALVYSGYITLPAAIVTTGEYIDRPVFKYVKCEATSELKKSAILPISESGTWLTKPSVTDQYNVKVMIPNSLATKFGAWQVQYNVCNSKVNDPSNCDRSSERQVVNANFFEINDVKGSQYVYLRYYEATLLGYKPKSTGTYQISYVPFGLKEYNTLGPSANPIVANDCKVSTSDESFVKRIISTDSSKAEQLLDSKGDNSYESSLQVNEVRWYVAGYVSSPAPSFKLTYAGQDAWCKKDGSTASIYKINNLQTGQGNYRIASVEYSDKLGTVTCCPGDKEPGRACSSDYNWVNIQPVDTQGNTKVQCSSFNPCDGGSYTAYGEGTIARYSCVNSVCQLQTKEVECANDNDCSASNQICDSNKWECIDANINIKGQVLDKIADNKVDCEKQDGTWIEEESTKKTWYNYIGIGEPEIVNKKYCQYNSGIPYATLALILVLSGIVYLFRGQIYSVYRATLGRLLP